MNVNWDKIDGLLPVIVQENNTNEVLMMAYMNEEALNLSKTTGIAHYFSRTKDRIWKKGEESGNFQIIKAMILDCDNDSLLLKVEQVGNVACHTGNKTCFFNDILTKAPNLKNMIKNEKYDILDSLYHVAIDRKANADLKDSYISHLYQNGENAYLKKVCEEVAEFSFAIKDLSKFKKYGELKQESFGEHCQNPNYDVVYEAADVLFHMIVALADFDIHPSRILDELKRREGKSGIEEKNARITKRHKDKH